jgi:histone deacetylase complex regulatory component SIN3
MPPKPNSRNWNDVQTAIATVAIVSTLGLWNLFASPSKNESTKTSHPVLPPTDPPGASAPTVMPKVKIMFTQATPQSTVQQALNNITRKKKNKNNNHGGSVSITQTKTS